MLDSTLNLDKVMAALQLLNQSLYRWILQVVVCVCVTNQSMGSIHRVPGLDPMSWRGVIQGGGVPGCRQVAGWLTNSTQHVGT
jgi:hypothetical protein